MLGVTGGIAAYKAVEVLRKLVESGAEVRVVMTRNAAKFVAPLTFQALSKRPVLVDEFSGWDPSSIGHIAVSEGLDCALVAPATANIIGKAAAGIADDALTSTLLALDCPLLMAPAMNDRMYRHKATQRNLAVLRERGVRIIDPDTGPLACGTEGCGRLASPERIVQEVLALRAPHDLSGRTFVVTAGPTREPVDAVRFLSNPSSGKMGFALARAARARGASVRLITGPVALERPAGIEVREVSTAAEMHRAVMELARDADAVIMAAAVSDFRPLEPSGRKIKKHEAPDHIRLEPTADILADLGRNTMGRVLVGFAAETDQVLEHARAKLKAKNLDLIIANDLSREGAGFGTNTNIVTMITRSGETTDLPLMSKDHAAEIIVAKVAEILRKQGESA